VVHSGERGVLKGAHFVVEKKAFYAYRGRGPMNSYTFLRLTNFILKSNKNVA